MVLRRPQIKDLQEIEEIAKGYDFPLVESFATAMVTEEAGQVKSFSVGRYILEGVMYLSGRKREKKASLDLIISKAIQDARDLEQEQLYVFAQDPKFAAVLEKRYKFRKLNSTPMVLDIEL